ncbi:MULTISPECIES: serine hydrolase domain-containing protein [unclassified Moorena]|uniref:serine hydrolase domain-containing protein n=1 Tax=unclassified Moorena TaxID=2683338 RepID=UPI0013BC5C1F|nr:MULTISPECIES: serine hydrolase domain-containing protein [unclassified Moorena]NEQ11546.1 beta-lactamase family protein [Moorena sp. SIO4E2]NER91403.1 beta-lactamase family protein [Moorena sp. SIO3A2]
MRYVLRILLAILIMSALIQQPSYAKSSDLYKYLSVPGARATLPVEAAKEPFSKKFVDHARERFNNFHLQMGGDHALYYLMNLPEFMPTAMSMPAVKFKRLKRDIQEDLDKIEVKTDSEGVLTLSDYSVHPTFRHQGIMMVHQGKVVFEAFPGMTKTDMHVWMSSAKTTVGLVSAMLAEEGKIDVSQPITQYVPELAGTAWDSLSVLNVLNHTTALDSEETGESVLDPNSVIVSYFSAIFGTPNSGGCQTEDTVSVLRAFWPLYEEEPGAVFRYSSPNTDVLTMMIEHIEEKPWAAVFEERVWGKLNARMPAMFNMRPEGVALPLGLMSTTLEDMARYGVLFTPSWQAVAQEDVVSDAVLTRIQTGGDPEAFKDSAKDESGFKSFGGERAESNSYQWDWIFEDGAMAKSGNLNQLIYVDPERDFVGVVVSTTPYVAPYGETKAPAFMRAAAKFLHGK